MIRLAFAACAAFFALTPTPGAAAPASRPATIEVCSGFGCIYRHKVRLGVSEDARLAAILEPGKKSAAAERTAIRRAVAWFDTRILAVTGVRDQPKGEIRYSRTRGQMDCLDESHNTRELLLHLQKRGLLVHHTVVRNESRGFLLDGRYPHFAAVIRDASGERWAVDSWYAEMGGEPDVMRLAEWKRRGVMGVR